MANDNRNYFGFIELSDGSRWYAKDEEAQSAIDNLPSAASVQTCKDIIDELT